MNDTQWEQLLRDDCCVVHRLGYSDWLEEHHRITEARAWRWAVKNKKQPFDCTKYTDKVEHLYNNKWVWFNGGCGPISQNGCGYASYAKEQTQSPDPNCSVLPEKVFLRLNWSGHAAYKADTEFDAYRDLVNVLIVLQSTNTV